MINRKDWRVSGAGLAIIADLDDHDRRPRDAVLRRYQALWLYQEFPQPWELGTIETKYRVAPHATETFRVQH